MQISRNPKTRFLHSDLNTTDMGTHLFKAFTTTVIFFAGLVMFDYIFFHELRVDKKWIIVTVGFFIYDLTSRIYKEKKLKKANRYSLVVAAECKDTESADIICRMLEANDIKAMVVEKKSAIYIKDSNLTAPVQVQVCGVDLEKALKIING